MLRKLTSLVLIGLFSLITCSAQTATIPAAKNRLKLTRADFLRAEIVKPDYEKESFKSVKRQNKLSGSAKTALWIGLFAAGVATVVILATTLGDEKGRTILPPICDPGPCR